MEVKIWPSARSLEVRKYETIQRENKRPDLCQNK